MVIVRLPLMTLILSSSITIISIQAKDDDPNVKSVFANEFPLTAKFRSGPRNAVSSYEKWKNLQFDMDGHTVDLQSNVLRFAPENYEYANRFAKENPQMLLLSTWRAASGNPKGKDAEQNGDPLGQSVIDFPGHFVLSPGTYMELGKNGLTSLATSFTVLNSKKIVVGPALLVEESISTGEKVWNNFEYVLVQKVNHDDRSIQVQRSFNGSPPSRNFPSNDKNDVRVYVANFPWDFRVNVDYVDWFFNFSPDCPRNDQNQTAVDVLLKNMMFPMKKGGPLEFIGGLDLASGPLVFAPANADYDIDGLLDDDTKYWQGVLNFYERVWKILGPNRVLTTDINFMMTDYISGPNQEGLARPSDPWKEVSRTVNNIVAWKVLSNLPFVSLSFVQYLTTLEDKTKRLDFYRLLNGYSTCLGMAADVDVGENGIEVLQRDELYKGAERVPRWLGKPTSSLIHPATMTPNLLLNYDGTSSNDWSSMWDHLSALRADLQIDGEDLIIVPSVKKTGFVTLYLSFELTQKTDLTVYMEAKSDDDQIVREIKLPRINVDVDTGPVRAMISNKEFLPISWLIRGATPPSHNSNTVIFDLRFELGGNIRIKKLSVHAATDTLACSFERGVVLINPSLKPVDLNLLDIFPDRKEYRYLQASPILKENISSKYHTQYDQTMNQNDGTLVKNARKVTVGERNALFLIIDLTKVTAPISSPTQTPTGNPISVSTNAPTTNPTTFPTKEPTFNPTKVSTGEPTFNPSKTTTARPTLFSTKISTKNPTPNPTNSPTYVVTSNPTKATTRNPTFPPMDLPTGDTTYNPTTNITNKPISAPTLIPKIPTDDPSSYPINSFTVNPTPPTNTPVKEPTLIPTKIPIGQQTSIPTNTPTPIEEKKDKANRKDKMKKIKDKNKNKNKNKEKDREKDKETKCKYRKTCD